MSLKQRRPAPPVPTPSPAAQAKFDAARQRHQSGDLAEAERLYRQTLALAPGHADCLHLLGVVQSQLGRPEAAVALIGQAIALAGGMPAYHSNLGNALRDLGRLGEATAAYRRAIALRPDYPEALNNLGAALRQQGHAADAIPHYRRAIALRPDYAEAHANLGVALAELGQTADAAASFRRAVAAKPGMARAHSGLGGVLRTLGALDEAADSYRRAVALRPESAEAQCGLGVVLLDQGTPDAALEPLRRAVAARPDWAEAQHNLAVAQLELAQPEAAAECCRAALALQPDFPEALNTLGLALADMDRTQEAADCYRRALALRPDDADALGNLGVALVRRQETDAAIACFRRVIERQPDAAISHFNLGIALLAQGDYVEGWREYEWRWQTPAMRKQLLAFAKPQWRGEPAAGQTLLVHAEQGFGDTMQFCRLVPLAAARGLRVVMLAPRPLLRLLRGLPGLTQISDSLADLPEFDLHCQTMSLPLALGITPDSVPNAMPYLHADPAQAAAWRARLAAEADPRPRVGLVWAGNPRANARANALMDRRRSIQPALLAPLLSQTHVRFFALQKGGPPAPPEFALTDVMDEMADFADTAALIANLDLVISVDTAVAHLASALGKPVWLLDRFDHCWRWLNGREDSPWYPALRIFRQPAAGDWPAAVARAAEALRQFTAAAPPSDDAEALFRRGVAQAQAGQHDAAITSFRATAERQPQRKAAWYNLGASLAQRGAFAEAADSFRRAVEIDASFAQAHNNLGSALRHLGQSQQAAQCFRRAIALQANFPEALANLGAVLTEDGQPAEAIALCRQAIAARPDFVDAHVHLSRALRITGDLEAAAASLRQALALKPDDAELLNLLGVLLQDLGRTDDAAEVYRRQPSPGEWAGAIAQAGEALRRFAGDADALFAAALEQHGAGQIEAAIDSLRRAAALRPSHVLTWYNLATLLVQLGDFAAAADGFRRAIALAPDFPEAHNNLGSALRELGDVDAAAPHFRHALRGKPDYPEALNNLGLALTEQGQPAEAVTACRRAVALRADYVDAHINLGNALRAGGQVAEAIPSYRRAIALDPQNAGAHHNLALALLALGEFAEGWAEYEWRWGTGQLAAARRNFAAPQWRGEPAAGRTLLIHAEQGFGDTLQFCRFAALAAARGLEVILEAPPALLRLLGSLHGPARVVARGAVLPAFDLQCPLLSLPLALGTTQASIPADIAYLRADPTEVARWQSRLVAAGVVGRRVGFAWAGNPMNRADRRRSLAPEQAARLLALPGAHWVSLQKSAPAGLPWFDAMAGSADFADTAALIANLDLVIAVDTAVAHLAAALGKPVWLLDRFDHCWRWLAGRRDSPWYPTLRIYRQPRPGDWDAVLTQVADDLGRLGPPA